jgi:hypothetical protein
LCCRLLLQQLQQLQLQLGYLQLPCQLLRLRLAGG